MRPHKSYRASQQDLEDTFYDKLFALGQFDSYTGRMVGLLEPDLWNDFTDSNVSKRHNQLN